MYRFGPQRFGNDSWFKVGTVEVTTTVFFVGLSVVSLLLSVISKPTFYDPLVLIGDAVRSGEVWRLVSWPVIAVPDIWQVLSIAIFFMIGSMLEAELGRKRMAWFLVLLTIVPAIVGTIVPVGRVILSNNGAWHYPPSGARALLSGLWVAFALRMPHARSFFNIPLWILLAVFEGIFLLQVMAGRDWALVLFTLVTMAMAALLARSFNLTEFEQIPKVTLPSFISGDPYQKSNRAREKAKRNDRKGASGSKARPFARNEPADVIPLRPEPRPEARLSREAQAEMDRLLDKIGDGGMASLSPAERAQLDALSRQLRGE